MQNQTQDPEMLSLCLLRECWPKPSGMQGEGQHDTGCDHLSHGI